MDQTWSNFMNLNKTHVFWISWPPYSVVKLDSAAEVQILRNLQPLVEVNASSIIHSADLLDIDLNNIHSILVKAACWLYWFHKKKETPYAKLAVSDYAVICQIITYTKNVTTVTQLDWPIVTPSQSPFIPGPSHS